MREKDHYEVLGVKRTVDNCGIRTAFRRLAKKYHPDVSGPGQTRRFQEILEAYAVLSDPESRASYNKNLRKRGEHAAVQSRARSSVPSQYTATVFSARTSFAVGLSERIRAPLDDEMFDFLFRDFWGWNSSGRGYQSRQPLDVEVVLSRDEAGRGGILPLPYPVLVQCRSCRGSGHAGLRVCASCHGRGITERKETVPVDIPAGVRDGSIVTVAVYHPENPDAILRIHIRVGDA